MLHLISSLLLLVSLPALAEFQNESELSLVQTSGNSELQTTNARSTSIITQGGEKYRFGGHYIYGESGEAVTVRNWDINLRYEVLYSPRFAFVLGEVIEGNKISGIKTRYNSDIGSKYYYSLEDERDSFIEISYRYTTEDRYSPLGNTYASKARIYNELNDKISETLQYRLWLEYIPSFTDSEDYLVNLEASVTSIINSVFSLRIGYQGNYDNLPAKEGFKAYDSTTTTSLVVKY